MPPAMAKKRQHGKIIGGFHLYCTARENFSKTFKKKNHAALRKKVTKQGQRGLPSNTLYLYYSTGGFFF
jgi:hypothetical protein